MDNDKQPKINIGKLSEIMSVVLNGEVDQKRYVDFCEKVLQQNIKKLELQELEKLYEDGESMLNEYVISESTKIDNELVLKLEFAITTIIYNINNIMNKQLLEMYTKNKEENEILSTCSKKIELESKDLRKQMESILTTILAVILTISIIPAAIAGIEKINPNYILPFLSSIILFGILMITFIFSLYQNKLKCQSWVIIAISLIICLVFWISSFKFDIKISPSVNNVNIYEKE